MEQEQNSQDTGHELTSDQERFKQLSIFETLK